MITVKGKELSEEIVVKACEKYGISFDTSGLKKVQHCHLCIEVKPGAMTALLSWKNSDSWCYEGPTAISAIILNLQEALAVIKGERAVIEGEGNDKD